MRGIIVITVFISFSTVSHAQKLNFKEWTPPTEKLKLLSIDTSTKHTTTLDIIRKDDYHSFYDKHLGGMCKLENTMSASAQMPVRIRLGTVQYVDRLEMKHIKVPDKIPSETKQ